LAPEEKVQSEKGRANFCGKTLRILTLPNLRIVEYRVAVEKSNFQNLIKIKYMSLHLFHSKFVISPKHGVHNLSLS